MKKILKIMLAIAFTIALIVPATTTLAFNSGGNPSVTGPNTITWTGQGAHDDGVLDTENCAAQPDWEIEENQGYLHWIFTTDGGSASTEMGKAPVLTLSGTGFGIYNSSKDNAKKDELFASTFHFYTPYFKPDSNLTAVVSFNTVTPGGGSWILTISNGCPGNGNGGPEATLTVIKTAVTSYTRTHNWDIDKKVETENGYTEGDYPKVWLYVDGSGNETATWTIDLTYEGYEDSDFNVSGDITIENTGDLPVNITSVDDLLGDDEISVDVVFDVEFPYSIAVGETIIGTYSQDVDGMITGQNVVTVNTDLADDEGYPITFEGYADIVWGDPTNEVNKTVSIKDISDLFGEVELGTVTAPNGDTFTYTKDFAWSDYANYGPSADYIYENTATIVETEQSANATLKVNVQGYIYETAYAKGGNSICFIPTFANWGWTNPIIPGTYTWDLWAGAGQCDTSKGTLVGDVTVVYSGGTVTVEYNLDSPYILKETHAYAGTNMFPQVKQGKIMVNTVAPGQYYIGSSLSGDIYVIAHAVVGIPDPKFGP